jgi:hypothetical protein
VAELRLGPHIELIDLSMLERLGPGHLDGNPTWLPRGHIVGSVMITIPRVQLLTSECSLWTHGHN